MRPYFTLYVISVLTANLVSGLEFIKTYEAYGYIGPRESLITPPLHNRPSDGHVNSYVKFNWPLSDVGANGGDDQVKHINRRPAQSSSVVFTSKHGSSCHPTQTPPQAIDPSFQKAIRMLPSSVRFAYRMDIMDAKLFKFCKLEAPKYRHCLTLHFSWHSHSLLCSQHRQLLAAHAILTSTRYSCCELVPGSKYPGRNKHMAITLCSNGGV